MIIFQCVTSNIWQLTFDTCDGGLYGITFGIQYVALCTCLIARLVGVYINMASQIKYDLTNIVGSFMQRVMYYKYQVILRL